LVSRQDEIITELQDKQIKEVVLVQNIPMNFKIKLNDKVSPLKIVVLYLDNDASKLVTGYISFLNKEPSES